MKPDSMADFYNAFHAVWRHRYEHEMEAQGHNNLEIKPKPLHKDLASAISFVQNHNAQNENRYSEDQQQEVYSVLRQKQIRS